MNIDSLTLLTFIETRMEDLIDLEETLNPDHVKAAQKEREKVGLIIKYEKFRTLIGGNTHKYVFFACDYCHPPLHVKFILLIKY